MRAILPLFVILLSTLFSPIAQGQSESPLETENHVIYYNVFPTSALPEAMARAYGITRSDTRIMLNITVQRRLEEGTEPATARIRAQAVNLNSQLRRFQMREITEDDAIYYIGEIGISDNETLDFEIEVAPEGEREFETISFRRSFQ
jgi:hypothetical protein